MYVYRIVYLGAGCTDHFSILYSNIHKVYCICSKNVVMDCSLSRLIATNNSLAPHCQPILY